MGISNRLLVHPDSPGNVSNAAPKEIELREFAADGVHQAAAELLPRYLSPPASVVELGAGAGAFSDRLKSLGYTVTASDLDPARFNAPGVPFVRCDLDEDWPQVLQQSWLDRLCAIEVVEHLRHPWKFFAQCHALLRAGGIFLLSTPNVSSKWSRVYFLLQGVPLGFSKRNMLAIGHINPLTFQELAYIAECTGFEVVGRFPAGEFKVTGGSRIGDFLKKNLFGALCALLRPLMRRVESGYCHVVVLRKR